MDPREGTSRKIRRILVVDDDADLLGLVELILKNEGYLVDLAASAEECAQKLNQHLPDVLILDIMMPKINGVQIVKKLKSFPKMAAIPIIFLTALEEKKYRQAALFELDADFYITKPFDHEDLIDKVHQAIRYQRHTQE